jgi:hypothetical protein
MALDSLSESTSDANTSLFASLFASSMRADDTEFAEVLQGCANRPIMIACALDQFVVRDPLLRDSVSARSIGSSGAGLQTAGVQVPAILGKQVCRNVTPGSHQPDTAAPAPMLQVLQCRSPSSIYTTLTLMFVVPMGRRRRPSHSTWQHRTSTSQGPA